MTAPADMTNAEMNAAVAERVMEWKRVSTPLRRPGSGECSWRWWRESENRWCFRKTFDWSPTTDPRDWMMVVERMRELGWRASMHSSDSGYLAAFYKMTPGPLWEHDARTSLGRAICEASLGALRSDQCG